MDNGEIKQVEGVVEEINGTPLPAIITPEQTINEVIEFTEKMKSFVDSALKDGEDYGIIPGCGKKPTLLKPGAEKLKNFFGLGDKIVSSSKVEDHNSVFFMYTYSIAVFKLNNPSVIIAMSEGSANNKETKYVKQNPYNILNTLQKMAQKRALVSAIISATRASHKFTCDIEDMDIQSNGSTPKQTNNATPPSKPKTNGYSNDLDDNFPIKFCTFNKEFIGKRIGTLNEKECQVFLDGVVNVDFKNKVRRYIEKRFNVQG